MDIVKNRPLAEKTWYELHDQVLSHIPESVEKSAINDKQKIMKLSKVKIDKKT